MIVSSTVPVQYKNMPLADYLAARFTYLSREEWEGRIADGRITVNGQPAAPQMIVRQGDEVGYDMPDPPPLPVNFDYRIVYEDAWLLGIDKPGNLNVHAAGKYVTANLMYHLRHVHAPPYPHAHLANRLDKDTSGVMIVAKEKKTLKVMNQLFAGYGVEKAYAALVHGVPAPRSGVIERPVGRVPALRGVYRYGTEGAENPKEAVTHYEVTETFGDDYALLTLRPQTGRTHQLRVHLAHIGHPIVGDRLYTMSDEDYLATYEKTAVAFPLINRQALHCTLNRFRHPYTGELCAITAPLPQDMRALLARLRQSEEQRGGGAEGQK